MDWRTKAVAQALLAALPGGGAVNECLQRLVGKRRSGNLKHRIEGKLSEIDRMLQSLQGCGFDLQGRDVLEIGTGWAPFTALHLAARGARVTTIDLTRHLKSTPTTRRMVSGMLEPIRLQGLLSAERREALDRFVSGESAVERLLESFGIRYHAPVPDDLLLRLPSKSFDLVFSLAVLEHVRPEDLKTVLEGQRRLLREGGMAFHDIGLGDHFTGYDASITFVNFLQYEGAFWRWLGENRLAYHNRLRRSDFHRLFEEFGFEERWSEPRVDPRSVEALNTGRVRVIDQFRGYEVEDLATWRWVVLLGRMPAAGACSVGLEQAPLAEGPMAETACCVGGADSALLTRPMPGARIRSAPGAMSELA